MDNIYIDRVLSGDVEAFRYFIKTYKDMGFNLAISIIKDEQFAEEIVQDAFMKAFQGLRSFKRTAKFKSWFYRIVVNESFQRLRSVKKKETSIKEISTITGWTNSNIKVILHRARKNTRVIWNKQYKR